MTTYPTPRPASSVKIDYRELAKLVAKGRQQPAQDDAIFDVNEGDYSALAAELAKQRKDHPVYSVGQGIAEVVGDIGGAFFEKKAADDAKEKKTALNTDIARIFTPPDAYENNMFSPDKVAKNQVGQFAAENPNDYGENPKLYIDLANALHPKPPAQWKDEPVGVGGLGQRNSETGELNVNVQPPDPDAAARLAQGQVRLDQTDRRLEKMDAAAIAAQKRTDDMTERANRPKVANKVDTKTGKPLLLDPQTGGYVFEDGSAADANYVLDSSKFQEHVDDATTKVKATGIAKSLITVVDNNPGAFSLINKIDSGARGLFGDRAAKSAYTSAEQTARATIIKDSAQAIKDLYGATLTQIEASGRATEFLVGEGDSADTVKAKLNAAIIAASKDIEYIPKSAVQKARMLLIPPEAAAELSKNNTEEMRNHFDEKYGAGMATAVLK